LPQDGGRARRAGLTHNGLPGSMSRTSPSNAGRTPRADHLWTLEGLPSRRTSSRLHSAATTGGN